MQESVSKKKDIVDQMADLNLNDIEYGSADYEKLQDLHSKMSDIDSPTLDQSDLQKGREGGRSQRFVEGSGNHAFGEDQVTSKDDCETLPRD